MTDRFDIIALTGKPGDPSVGDSFESLVAQLLALGRRVLVDPSVASMIPEARVERPTLESLLADAQLMIAVGGDGTMLYATRLVAAHGIPLLGINRGRLGFLADIGPSELGERVDQVLAGRYAVDRRQMLVAEIDDGREPRSATALNDVVVQKREPGRMLDLETRVDGVYVNTHGGDGLIVATPTGSTAYALSGGGPIIFPGTDAFAMVPICPHTLSDRPLVIPGDRKIEVRLAASEQTGSEVSCDGISLGVMRPGDVLRIRRARRRLTLLHPEDYDYFRILRSKLGWGRGKHGRGGRS
jgi:NAD+ kinase